MNRIQNSARWDYTLLAADYDRRPDYHPGLLDEVIGQFALGGDDCVLDVGAGTGKLSSVLCRHSAQVIACEPNAAMRARGRHNTRTLPIRWLAASGESLPLAAASVGAVCYGSSFNVLDAASALSEATRVLRRGGWWMAAWNHRDLDDPLQRQVEAIIHRWIPGFDYGRRRRSPAADLAAHGGLELRGQREARFVVELPAAQWIGAWRSHATLQSQAGDRFEAVLVDLSDLLAGCETLQVPYYTRVWWAQCTRRTA